MNMLY